MPYMAIGNDDSWTRIASGSTEMSGAYIIEEADADEDDKEEEDEGESGGNSGTTLPKKMRRLRFLQNQHFVQTEVQLLPEGEEEEKEEEEEEEAPALVNSEDGVSGTGGGRNDMIMSIYLPQASLRDPPTRVALCEAATQLYGALGWTLGDVEETMGGKTFDLSYMDSHHATALSALCLCPSLLQRASTPPSISTSSRKEIVRGLVVGLGGGAFPMFAQEYLPYATHHVCDIDPGLLELAVHYFGYAPGDGKVTFVPREGVSLIRELAISVEAENNSSTDSAETSLSGSAMDYIFLDVDSKDPSLGLSAPPPTFLTSTALEDTYSLLAPGGLLIVNVVARTVTLLDDLKYKLSECFCGYGVGAQEIMAQQQQGAAGTGSEEDDVRAMFRQAMSSDGETADFSETLSKLTVPGHDGDKEGGLDEDEVDLDDGIDDDENTVEGQEKVQVEDSEESRATSQQEQVRANIALGRSEGGAAGKRRGRVFLVRPGEDVVNLILVAVKEGSPPSVSNLGPAGSVTVSTRPILDLLSEEQGGKEQLEGVGEVRVAATPRDRIKERDTVMRAWLASLGKADDPHGLRRLAVKIETIS